MEYETYLSEIPFFKNQEVSYQLDSLTKVLQRGITLEYVQELIRLKKTFALFLLDVDNFKYVNDTYGHLYGDKVLVAVVETVKQVIEPYHGVLGRIGGDEFLMIVLDFKEYDEIYQIGRSVNVKMAELAQKEEPILVTTTTGIARFPLDAKNYEDLFVCADKALYRGKNKGRNCFIIYLPELHAKINIQDIKANYTTTNMLKMIFDFLSDPRRNTEVKIISLFDFLMKYIGMDSICINGEHQLEYLVKKESLANIEWISNKEYRKLRGLDDMVIINKRAHIKEQSPFLFKKLVQQGIASCLVISCKVGHRDYGYLRADMSHQRVWSKDEKEILLVASKAIAMLKSEGNLS